MDKEMNGPIVGLSDTDQYYLEEYNDLQWLVRDRTAGVARGYQPGVYISGPPGTGKTWTVRNTLESIDVPATLRNGRMTAPGLFKMLNTHRQHTIVLDDIPNLVTERPAQQIMMAALGGVGGEPRKVTLTTAEVDGFSEFEFTGSMIAISNLPLRADPLASAIQSRVPVLEFDPPTESLCAFLRYRALQGHKGLTAEQCLEVAEFVISESLSADFPIDLRAYDKAIGDYRQWHDGHANHHWQTMVRSSLKQLMADKGSKPISREQRRAEEQEIALELSREFPDETAERNRRWQERTKKSIDTLYRRRRELEADGRL